MTKNKANSWTSLFKVFWLLYTQLLFLAVIFYTLGHAYADFIEPLLIVNSSTTTTVLNVIGELSFFIILFVSFHICNKYSFKFFKLIKQLL